MQYLGALQNYSAVRKKNIILRRKSLKRNPCSTPESREIKESIYEESS
jgi:hypothetical protein